MPSGSMFMRNPPMPLEICYPNGIPESVLKEVGRSRSFLEYKRADLISSASLYRCTRQTVDNIIDGISPVTTQGEARVALLKSLECSCFSCCCSSRTFQWRLKLTCPSQRKGGCRGLDRYLSTSRPSVRTRSWGAEALVHRH